MEPTFLIKMPESKSSASRPKSSNKTGRKSDRNNNNNKLNNESKGIRHKTKNKPCEKSPSQGHHKSNKLQPLVQQPAKAYFGVKKLPTITNAAEEYVPVPSLKPRISAKSLRSVSQNLAGIQIRSDSKCATPTGIRTKTRSTASRPTTSKSWNSTSTKSSSSKSSSRSTSSLQIDKTQSKKANSNSNTDSGDATRSPKKKKKQNLLVAIKPSNVESEKVRFMASRLHDYNPRFVYLNPPTEGDLQRYARPSMKLLNQAIKIMRIVIKRYGSYEKFEAANGGPLISRREFTNQFKEYVAMERLENKVLLYLGEEIVSRALMTRSKGKPCLSVRVSTMREQWVPGLLMHELGTHYQRGANNRHQPWHNARGRDAHNLLPANPTEEGLASLHSVLCRDDPYLWRAALLYYTTYKASLMPFSNLFHDLEQFVTDPVVRWDYCVRAKRGLVDTSDPGCFSKDQVYLTGIFEILRYRHRIDFHSLVRLGKVARQDVERLKPQAVLDPKTVKIPFFMLDLQAYKAKLHYIMSKNGITDVELVRLYPDVDGEVWGAER